MTEQVRLHEWLRKKKLEEVEFGWLGETKFQKHIKMLYRLRDHLLKTCPDPKKIIRTLRLHFWYG